MPRKETRRRLRWRLGVLAALLPVSALLMSSLAGAPASADGAPGPTIILDMPVNGAWDTYCLDVWGDQRSPTGVPVDAYECNGTEAQNWYFDYTGNCVDNDCAPLYHIELAQDHSLCLDDWHSLGNSGNPVQIYRCNGTDAQLWQVGPPGSWNLLNIGATNSALQGMCVTTPGYTVTAPGATEPVQLVMEPCSAQDWDQRWKSAGSSI